MIELPLDNLSIKPLPSVPILKLTDRLAIHSRRQRRQRIDVDREAQLANAAVAHHKEAYTRMRAAKAAVGETAVALWGLQDPMVGGGVLLNAGHPAIRIVLPAENRAIFILPAQRVGANVLLTAKQRVARAVGDVRESQLRAEGLHCGEGS